MSHTPGPWFDYDEDGCITAELDLTDAGIEPEGICAVFAGPHAEDNAALIMAAPDLLEACFLALRNLEFHDELPGPRSALRKAIEKATGEWPS